jgi:hypothetical protein
MPEDGSRRAPISTPSRTLINCLNTGSQKARKCRGMCSENVEHFLYVAQSMGQTPQCPPKKHVDMLNKVPTN